MSTNSEVESDTMMLCCASCGIAEDNDTKLTTCDACKLVRYCSDKCQREHMPQHTRDCEERAAELRDEILFKQPESSHYGDCPICLLPLRIDGMKSTMYSCCCKMICDGCGYANQMRELEESLEQKCPFCRHPRPKSQEESVRNRMKRAEANDPVALREVGKQCCHDGDYDAAFQYLSKAAELGDVGAHYELSVMYNEEEGVEKDDKKELHHLEQAAIGGHPDARINLGCVEEENGRADRAIKHWIIAATLGSDDSLDALREGFKRGLMSKEDFVSVLRAHQAAVDATNSSQRDEAEAALQLLEAEKSARQY